MRWAWAKVLGLGLSLGCRAEVDVPNEAHWLSLSAWQDGELVRATPLFQRENRSIWAEPGQDLRWIGFAETALDAERLDGDQPLRLVEGCEPTLPPTELHGTLADGQLVLGAALPQPLTADWLGEVCDVPGVAFAYSCGPSSTQRVRLPSSHECVQPLGASGLALGWSLGPELCRDEERLACERFGDEALPCIARFADGCRAELADEAEPSFEVELQSVDVAYSPAVQTIAPFSLTPAIFRTGRITDFVVHEPTRTLVVVSGANRSDLPVACGPGNRRNALNSRLSFYDAESLTLTSTLAIPGCVGAVAAAPDGRIVAIRRRRVDAVARPGELELVSATPRTATSTTPRVRSIALLGADDSEIIGLVITELGIAVVSTEANQFLIDLGLRAHRAYPGAISSRPRLDGSSLISIEVGTHDVCTTPIDLGLDFSPSCETHCGPVPASDPLALTLGVLPTPIGLISTLVGPRTGALVECDAGLAWTEPLERFLQPTLIEPWVEGQLLVVGISTDDDGLIVAVAQRWSLADRRFIPGRLQLPALFANRAHRSSDGSLYLMLAWTGSIVRLRPL